jgi:hypothetical protein
MTHRVHRAYRVETLLKDFCIIFSSDLVRQVHRLVLLKPLIVQFSKSMIFELIWNNLSIFKFFVWMISTHSNFVIFKMKKFLHENVCLNTVISFVAILIIFSNIFQEFQKAWRHWKFDMLDFFEDSPLNNSPFDTFQII